MDEDEEIEKWVNLLNPHSMGAFRDRVFIVGPKTQTRENVSESLRAVSSLIRHGLIRKLPLEAGGQRYVAEPMFHEIVNEGGWISHRKSIDNKAFIESKTTKLTIKSLTRGRFVDYFAIINGSVAIALSIYAILSAPDYSKYDQGINDVQNIRTEMSKIGTSLDSLRSRLDSVPRKAPRRFPKTK